MYYVTVGVKQGQMGSSMLPDKVQCEHCGAWSLPHAIHYIYRPEIEGHRITQVLTQIVMVIECPLCGANTQTASAEAGEASG